MPSSAAKTLVPDRGDSKRGLEDYQSRLNRGAHDDRQRRGSDNSRRDDRGSSDTNGFRNERNVDRKPWDTSRSVKTERDLDGGSMRVPNRGWDETPRSRGPGGWGKADPSKRKVMSWDQTPRSSRNGKDRSPEGLDAVDMTGKEWEEEQVRLDRDWYSYDDEGAVVSVSYQANYTR